ncbi:hypothetical protein C0J52_15320, partial [Blattella germanica]
LPSLFLGKLCVPNNGNASTANKEVISSISRRIAILRQQYAKLTRLGRSLSCYSKQCNVNSVQGATSASSQISPCYSPLCLQKARVRRELLVHLRKANTHSNNNNLLATTVPASKVVATPTQKQPVKEAEGADGMEAIRKDLESAVAVATAAEEESKVSVPLGEKSSLGDSTPQPQVNVTKESVEDEKKVECLKSDQDSASQQSIEVERTKPETSDTSSSVTCSEVDVSTTVTPTPTSTTHSVLPPTPPALNEMEVSTMTPYSCAEVEVSTSTPEEDVCGETTEVQVTTTTTTTTTTTATTQQTLHIVDGAVQSVKVTESKAVLQNTQTNVVASNATSGKLLNSILTSKNKAASSDLTTVVKTEQTSSTTKTVTSQKSTTAEGEQKGENVRVYSTTCTKGRVYLKKVTVSAADRRKKRIPVKYPLCSTFQTKSKRRNMLILPQNELRRLARLGGRLSVNGYHHLAKANQSVWPYPCSRPLFKTCWLYRTVNLRSLAAAALQLRIMWACLRWDDMQVKPPSNDGKHQVTTDTEIMTLEILKHRHVGEFLDRTQYMRRKVVIPLELPKTVREVTSIRSGLRKRKRAESPQSTEPQVTEEWVDEDKLELWEIKQYGDRLEKANAQVVTRSRSGSLAPKAGGDGGAGATGAGATGKLETVSGKATPEEIKEKMEQQLRMQRAAHQQKRALETLKVPGGQVLKVVPTTQQGQQLVQMPDGKLHVLNTTQVQTSQLQQVAGNRVLAAGTKASMIRTSGSTTAQQTPTTTKVNTTTAKQIAIAAAPSAATAQLKVDVPQSPTKSPQQHVMIRQQIAGTQVVQKVAAQPGTVVVSGGQVFAPGQIVVSGNQVVGTPTQVMTAGGQLLSTGQLVVSGSNLAAQLASGKAQLATIGGQQVLIRTVTPGANTMVVSGSGSVPALTSTNAAAAGTTVATASGNLLVKTVTAPVSGGQQQTIQMPVKALKSPVGAGTATTVVSSPTKTQLATSVSQNTVLQQQATEGGQVQTVPSNTQSTEVPQSPVALQQQQAVTPQPQQQSPQQTPAEAPAPVEEKQLSAEASLEQQLLVGQPPGTVIKCVTAQVIQTPQGPRIVLQGLQGAEFTQQQLSVVQQQVKQQLLRAQATTGKQGVLGPTKIYLAVQPPPAPVQQAPTTPTPAASAPAVTSPVQAASPVISQSPVKTQPKVVVQQVAQPDTPQIGLAAATSPTSAGTAVNVSQQVVVNGQQQPSSEQLLSPGGTAADGTTTAGTGGLIGITSGATSASNKFVLTPEYIQHSDSRAFDPQEIIGSLNIMYAYTYGPCGLQHIQAPDDIVIIISIAELSHFWGDMDIAVYGLEQVSRSAVKCGFVLLNKRTFKKLIQLQRYQEKQMKEKDMPVQPQVASSILSKVAAKKRPSAATAQGVTNNQQLLATIKDDWDSPPKRKAAKIETKDSKTAREDHSSEEKSPPGNTTARSRTGKWRETQEERRRQQVLTKLQVLLFRHKELLKKDMIKKRALLEKELQIEIQKDLSNELAARTKAERSKQDEVRTGSGKRKSAPVSGSAISPPSVSRGGAGGGRPRKQQRSTSGPPSGGNAAAGVGGGGAGRKKEKLYCLCRTPYDETKFYVGCDLCNNWFHGECVGITEEMSKSLTEFVCTECRHARDTQELYCLCKQPYDESQSADNRIEDKRKKLQKVE